MIFTKSGALRGELTVPGDKSISHRAVMFGALANGITEITNFLQGADCLSTIECFRRLGIQIENKPDKILIHGKGLHGFQAPRETLDTGNSGTTTRLIAGILSGQSFETTLDGDSSVRKRPMKRIMEPLRQMGANIESVLDNGCVPLRIKGGSLHGVCYQSPVASAQVKSSVLLAGLYADSPTTVIEPSLSRNHSEIMLSHFGAKIETIDTEVTIEPEPRLFGQQVEVPGDISSAAYFLAAALVIPGSELLIKNVGINPTRAGILHVCQQMGADITFINQNADHGEPTADLLVRYSTLRGVTVGGSMIPSSIDELPVIAVLACLAKGTTVIKDAQELKFKESNRIDVMVHNLSAMGAHIQATEDGMIIEGGYPLHGATIDSEYDHRIAMSFAIAALTADGETRIKGADCVKISYPNFYKDLAKLQGKRQNKNSYSLYEPLKSRDGFSKMSRFVSFSQIN